MLCFNSKKEYISVACTTHRTFPTVIYTGKGFSLKPYVRFQNPFFSRIRGLHEHHAHHIAEFKNRLIASLILTVPILLFSETFQTMILGGKAIVFPMQEYVLLILSASIYVYGGWPFLRGLVNELKNRLPGMMTLIGTAITVAFTYSAATVFISLGMELFWELATLIDVMLLGHWIEAKSVLGASTALEELVRIMPTTAHVLKNGETVDVPVSKLKPGDVVVVKPGEKIPSDGTVLEGYSFVNEALLTGESKPVGKQEGARVIGGSINGEGSLKILIEKTGGETYLAQVLKLVKQAQESRTRTQDLANRAAALLFYLALTISIAAYVTWLAYGKPEQALESMVAVLVVACPHALGLAIPLVVAISTSITAKSGILIRNRKAFETVRNVSAVVFDKTGTLTLGDFGVSDTIPLIPEEDLLKLAASVELKSEHVAARAIVEYAKRKNVELLEAKEFRAIPGKGAYGRVDGKEVYVGGVSLLNDMKISVENDKMGELMKQGKTMVFTLVDSRLAGVFALSDTVRKESYEAVEKLRKMGIRVYMLTGDSQEVAKWVAEELGVDDYFAQVLPHEKAEKIRLLKENGFRVAMVGDGVNDAPALVTADVGIAIGAGTDVAIESADIILVRNDPRDVPKIIELSRKTYSKMVQNLWWATGYNVLTIPLAAGVLHDLGIILPPWLGALVMSLSTVIVALNTQTLRKYEPEGMQMERRRMVTDPVCGMKIEPETAYSRLEYSGQTVYFCSRHCEEEFRKNPEKYGKKN
ncbi:MAG: cadmium-translocating P-type ATPase [Candidatus Brockarchaeota archaeon]|nr:cadmium-translocating P-type ATPase [Candidatus Brockarchaeota archaeon]